MSDGTSKDLTTVSAAALAWAVDNYRAHMARPHGTCAVCGMLRPVYPEPDKTLVCLDCYESRNPRVL